MTTVATLSNENERRTGNEDAFSTILQVVFVLATFVAIALLSASSQLVFP
jgi:hypothetical protein